MIILSVDTGSKNWATSVIDFKTKKVLYCKTYVLTDKHLGNRMIFLLQEMSRLVKEFKVEQIAYEAPYFMKGKNAMGIYWCTGTLQMISAKYKVPISAYSATEVKKSVGTNQGKSNKEEVEKGVRTYLELPKSFSISDDHSADSLAVGITAYKKLLI